LGDYPRVALTFHGIEDQNPPVVLDEIWTEQDPWDYPLDTDGQSFVFSCANDTMDPYSPHNQRYSP
jgi:hypothetical protein